MKKKRISILFLFVCWLIYQIYFFGDDSSFELLSRNMCSSLGLIEPLEIVRGRTVCAYIVSIGPVLYMYTIHKFFRKKYSFLSWVVGIVMFVFSVFINKISELFVVNLGIIVFGFLLLLLLEFLKKEKIKTNSLVWIFACVLLSLLVNIVEICLLSILRQYSPESVNNLTSWLSDYASLAMGNIAMIILAPLFEELAFRGCVFKQLDEIFPTWFAIVVSALFWGIWHRNIGQFIYVFPFGLLQAWVFKKTDQLRYPILIHSCSNLVANTAFLEGNIFNDLFVLFMNFSASLSCVIMFLSVFISILILRKQ